MDKINELLDDKMIGERIKELCQGSGHRLTWIADKVGMTYQNLFKIFKKDSVDTKFIIKLASIINVPIWSFFNEEAPELNGGDSVEIVRLKNEIVENKKIITLLEETTKNYKIVFDYLAGEQKKNINSLG